MKLFKNYKWRVDMLGVLLFALLILPNIVYWCIPEFRDLNGNLGLNIFCNILEVLGVAAMIALARADKSSPFTFFSFTGTFTWLFLLLDYLAWIFFFCGFDNIAVVLFLAICPCVSLISYQAGRKNYVALVPTVAFAFFHIINIAVFVL